MSPDDICSRVLSTSSGYVRGLGHGEMPTSLIQRNRAAEVENANRRVDQAEKRVEELKKEMLNMRSMMEDMNSKQSHMESMLENVVALLPRSHTPTL